MVNRLEKVEAIVHKLEEESTKQDLSTMIQTFLKVILYLNQAFGRTDKEMAWKKEDEVTIEMQKLTNTYRSKSVLYLQLGSAALTTAGGLAGLGGILPGSSAGIALANKYPSAFSLFANAANAKSFSVASKSAGAFGQGAGSLTSIFENKNQRERVFVQHSYESLKQKTREREEGARESFANAKKALSSYEQAIQSAHSSAMRIVSSAGA